ncbi:hypothetical protein BpHYR1_040480 [Brachionus plicatilis]|uniref:Uncharacterized protein n=1 Tax=Brachionus plicatilis TaxID=10195 RepID=A0A3M7T3C1_BRAPC|nr:hypothetical protein BpHYR1_040480 [Brachionus plicatilis]
MVLNKNHWMPCFDNKKSAFYTQKKDYHNQANKDEDELVEEVIDVETGVEVAKENKRGRSKKLKTALEKEKLIKRGRPPKSKKYFICLNDF